MADNEQEEQLEQKGDGDASLEDVDTRNAEKDKGKFGWF